MKLNKTIYALSMAGMLGLWSCTSDEAMPDSNVASGERVPITIEVSHGGDVQTRTDLSEDLQEGGLTHTWTAGDELYLYDSTGAEAGKVTLESGEGTSNGIFTGKVTAASGEYCLWYFGSKQSTASDADFATCYPYVTISNGQVTIDLKKPTFMNVKDFSKVDVMSQMATVNVNGSTASVAEKITMRPHVALARFDLQNLPANVTGTLKLYDTKAKTPEYINTKQTLSLAKGETAKSEETEAYTFTDWSSDKDLYVAFVPYSSNLKFEYTYNKEVQENGSKKIYPIKNIHSFAENQNLIAGTYYQSFKPAEGSQTATVGGVEVPFEIDDSDNPGNTANWGGNGEIIQPGYEVKDIVFSEEWGWMNNTNSVPTYGGWATWITYTHNGKLASGMMVSDKIGSSGASKYYFQWGRYLGFNNLISEAYYDPYGDTQGTFYSACQPLGIDDTSIPTDQLRAIGVNWFNSNKGANARCFISNNSKEKSNLCALVFSTITTSFGAIDYISSKEITWEERCGNPAPQNYKIPTIEDYRGILPTQCWENGKEFTINGSKVDVREFQGVKYAIKWSVVNADLPYIEIRSFKTDKTINELDDSEFDRINPIQFKALGYLDPRYAKVTDSKKVGWFWTNETYVEDGNNYGAIMEITFNGTSATLCIAPCIRACGIPVMLIKDASKKPDSISPLFPLTGVSTKWIKNYPSNYVDAENY